MKASNGKHEKSITSRTINRSMFALLSILLLSNTLTHWTVQSLEPLSQWSEYMLYSSFFLCLALPGLYLFGLRPLTFLIKTVTQAEQSAFFNTQSLNNLIAHKSAILFSMRMVDQQLYLEWVNSDNLKDILGYSEEEVMQPDWWLTYLHDQDRERVIMESAKLFTGKPVTCNYRFKHKNGTTIWIHDELKLQCNKQGKPTHVLSIWTEMTEQQIAEQGLYTETRLINENEHRPYTSVPQVNPEFSRLSGYSADDIIKEIPTEGYGDREGAMLSRSMWQTIQREGYWQGEMKNSRNNGEVYSEWLTVTGLKDNEDGRITHHIENCADDFTERNNTEQRIHTLAFYDPLTKLPNRLLLQDRLEQSIAASGRSRQHGALLFMDLDRFKILNDTYGHNIGDLLLLEVTRRLQACVREGDTIARLGGDEFVMIMNALDKYASKAEAQAKKLAEKIRTALAEPYHFSVAVSQFHASTITYHSSTSIGVVLFLMHDSNTEELMQHADLAMYEAKHAGRDTICMFDPGMKTDIMARASLEADLHRGLQEKQFILHYQPQVDKAGNITGVEALVRWQHPLRGMVSPVEFIPLAEESGLILPLGTWVLETACTQLASWNARQETAHLTMAVNVSAHQFRQDDFVDQVLSALNNTGADPYKLKLELTESMLVYNVEDIIVKMTALKEKGVGFALDDFGTGYSSLTYLKRLPLDQLKIDQGFVRDILIDANDAAISQMIVALAESMGLTVIAEGVETDAQKDFLSTHGCHAYQGYLYSHPLSQEELEEFIRSSA